MSFFDNKTPLSSEVIELESGQEPSFLTIPANASSALLQCCFDGGLTDTTKFAAFNLTGTTPREDGPGFILGLHDYLELTNLEQMQEFRIIVAEVGIAGCKIFVQYFKSN